jgi:hypothetical protein
MGFDTREAANDDTDSKRGLLKGVRLKMWPGIVLSAAGGITLLATDSYLLSFFLGSATGIIVYGNQARPPHHDNDNDIDPGVA